MKYWNRNLAAALALAGAAALGACGGKGAFSSANGSPSAESPASTPATSPATSAPAPTSAPGPTSEPGTTATPQPAAKTYAHEWAVSPTGSDTAAGTPSAPFRTIMRAVQAAGPGDRITVQAGTYAEFVHIANVKAGTADAPILLQGEGKPKIVPAGQSVMVSIEEPYWTVDGFDVDGSGSSNTIGVGFQGGNTHGSVLSHSEVHDGSGGAAVSAWNHAEGVTIDSNDIHHWIIPNDDAHGVLVQWTAKNVNITHNSIHDCSGDSIQCIGPETFADGATPADHVLIENNDLYGSWEQSIDLKTCTNVTIRNNKMHKIRYAPRAGNAAIVVHMSAANVTIEKNELYDAGAAIGVGGNHIGPVPNNVIFRDNLVHDMITDNGQMAGAGVLAMGSTGLQVYNNTFTRIATTGMKIGWGDGGATQNMVVKNNLIDGAKPIELNTPDAPGVVIDYNLYDASASFVSMTSGTYPFSGWQALGYDVHSRQGTNLLDPTSFAPSPLAVDAGTNMGQPFCGAAPDLGAVETGC